MPNTSITISSIGSYPVAMNWRGRAPALVTVTLGSTTMTTDFQVQYSPDDLQISSSPTWFGMSSLGMTNANSTTHFSSAYADNGFVAQIVVPVGAVRLNSTAISSSSLTFKVIQGESW
jgi:hypothetical protein